MDYSFREIAIIPRNIHPDGYFIFIFDILSSLIPTTEAASFVKHRIRKSTYFLSKLLTVFPSSIEAFFNGFGSWGPSISSNYVLSSSSSAILSISASNCSSALSFIFIFRIFGVYISVNLLPITLSST